MSALVHQEHFRALQLFDQIPAGHTGVIVTGSDFEPHLRRGEIAVIDLADHVPMHGELFVVQYEGVFGKVARIAQMFGREVLNERLETWTGCFARHKFAQPGEIVLSDGPMRAENWSKKRCVGRVVGYMAPQWEGARR